MTSPSNRYVTVTNLTTSLLIYEQKSLNKMYLRFQQVANTKKVRRPYKLQSPEIPNLYLEKLISDKDGSSDREIDWEALHHEVGQVGLGKWGQLCVQHFRLVKHTRKYQRWIMQRRINSATNQLKKATSGIAQHLGRVEGFTNTRCSVPRNSYEISTTSSPRTGDHDSDCILDSSFDDTSMCMPFYCDNTDNIDSMSMTTGSSVSVEMNRNYVICPGQKKKVCGRGCGDLDPAQTEDKSPGLDELPSSDSNRSTGIAIQEELNEEDKRIEKEVRDVLAYIVDEVGRKHIARVVRNVLMSHVDDVYQGRITEGDRSNFVTLPSHLQYEYDANMAQADVVLDPEDQAPRLPEPCLQHADSVPLDHDTSLDAGDISSLFQDSLDILDAVIQEHYDDIDDEQSNRHTTSPIASSTDCMKSYDRAYRNIKCSVSMDTVLRELERTRNDTEQIGRISSQTSSTDSGTVSVMFCKDVDDLDLPGGSVGESVGGSVGGSIGANEFLLKGFSNGEHFLSRTEITEKVPEGAKAHNDIYTSFSSPSLMMSSPYRTDMTPVAVMSHTDHAEDDSDSTYQSSVTSSASEAVVDRPCGDACEASFSDTTFFTTDEEFRDEAEVQELLNDEVEWNQQIAEDPAGTPRNSTSESCSLDTIASSVPSASLDDIAFSVPSASIGNIVSSVPSASLDNIVSSVPSGNAMFLLDKSVTDSELGIEVIDLDSVSDVSNLFLDTNPSDRERRHHCCNKYTALEAPPVSPGRSWSRHSKGGCHVS